MVQQVLPWDALFLAGFAYSGYRTLGRWLKYTDDVAKSQSGDFEQVQTQLAAMLAAQMSEHMPEQQQQQAQQQQ